ncbi:MAG: hypothetical protein H0U95_06920 [Bacteroidetes bacterium]|nr:hypothetical protein [Bacteroidota bacterium]
MKKFSIILLILINTFFFAQSPPPQLINYQGVARDVSGNPVMGTIGLKFHIHQTTATGAIIFTETHAPVANAFGIFNTQIGSTNPSQFAAINWGADDYFLEVLIDPAGGTSYTSVGQQQLVSVPYALYAKSAGNSSSYSPGSNITFSGPASSPTINSNPNLSLSGNVLNISGSGTPVTLPTLSLTATPNVTLTSPAVNSYNMSVPNYVAGNNITITPPASGNNYTINANGTATNAPFSLSVNAPHNVTPGPAANLTIVPPNLSVTGGGGIVTSNTLPNYAINIPTVVVSPTIGGLSFTQNGNTSTVAIGSGPWTNTASTVYLINGLNNVGIGTNISTAKLTVTTSIAIDAILAQSAGANGVMALSNSSSTLDAGVSAINNGSGHGVIGQTISTNTAVTGMHGINNGIGFGVMGTTGSTNGFVSGVKGNNNSAGPGVYGENLSGSASVDAHGVKGMTGNPAAQATGVTGINNNVGAGVFGINTTSLNSGNAHGVYGRTSASAINAYGVFGENLGIGSGVFGLTSSLASNAYGVYGKNIGFGDGVRGVSTYTSAGVFGQNTAGGVGVMASIPTLTVAGGFNVALQVDNGHVKSTAVNSPSVSTFSATGGAVSATYTLTNANATDVKGSILAVCTTTGLINPGGQLTIKVSFNKLYQVPPTIVITPTSDFGVMNYFISNVGPGSFNLTIKNNTSLSVGSVAMNFNFNYFVIE